MEHPVDERAEALIAAKGRRIIRNSWVVESAWGYFLSTDSVGHQYRFAWKKNPDEALRFIDQNSADDVMFTVRHTVPDLFPPVVPMPEAKEYGYIFTDDHDVIFCGKPNVPD